jgi:hypothetical protein
MKGSHVKRIHLRTALAASAMLVVGLMATPASAGTSGGTWTQYPGPSTTYFAEVQQPINSANTSNWSAKSKGGIPVMYKLFQGTGPAVFESIYSDNTTINDEGGTCGTGSGADHANDCAFETFTPTGTLTFRQITELSTRYTFSLGNCHGGSLRWSVRTAAGPVFIYYGDYPNFTDCKTNSQSGTNMVGLGDLRYDTSNVGGTFYDTYANALGLMGDAPLLRVSLVLDSGWGGDQRATVSDTTISTATDSTVYQWNAGGSGGFTQTCDLPNATIDVDKFDPNASGAINEDTVYPNGAADSGDSFRVVDCKYQYVLSIPSLKTALNPNLVGTYDVEIKIGGVAVPTAGTSEVTFDLK